MASLMPTMYHFVADFFVSFLNPLGPYFVERFQVSPRLMAMTISAISTTSAFTQIFFGGLSDRITLKNLYMFVCILITVVASMFIGFSSGLLLLTLVFMAIFLANAAFHPMGAAVAGEKGSTSLVIFSFSGSMATAVGPIFITSFVEKLGIGKVWLVGMIALITTAILGSTSLFQRFPSVKKRKFKLHEFKPLIGIWILVTFRSFAVSVMHIFGPMYTRLLGYEITFGGLLLSTGLTIGTFANFLGARMSNRVDYRLLNAISFGGMTFAIFMFSHVTSFYPLLVFFVLLDIFMFLTMAANTHYAQSMFPSSRGLASAIAMGLSWATGSALNFVYSSIFGKDVYLAIKLMGPITLAGTVITLIAFLKSRASRST